MIDKLVNVQFTDPVWGIIVLWRPLYDAEDSWGILSELRGTPWEEHIPTIDGASLSHALHGHATPLMDQLGPDPRHLGKRIPDPFRWCSLVNTCTMAGTACHPSGGKKLQDCYEAPVHPRVSLLVSFVTLCWRDGQYVVVVEGDEFSIT